VEGNDDQRPFGAGGVDGGPRVTHVGPGVDYIGEPRAQAEFGAGGLGASHAPNSDLASQYRRLVGRRGKKRALIAVGPLDAGDFQS